jgi:hypothetical protein
MTLRALFTRAAEGERSALIRIATAGGIAIAVVLIGWTVVLLLLP